MFKVLFIYIYFWSLFFVRHGSVCSRRRGRGLWSHQLWEAAGLGRDAQVLLGCQQKSPRRGPVGLKQHFVLPSTPRPSHPDPRTPVPASPRAPAGGVHQGLESQRPAPHCQQGRTPSPTPGLGWAGQTQCQPAPAHLRGCSVRPPGARCRALTASRRDEKASSFGRQHGLPGPSPISAPVPGSLLRG